MKEEGEEEGEEEEGDEEPAPDDEAHDYAEDAAETEVEPLLDEIALAEHHKHVDKLDEVAGEEHPRVLEGQVFQSFKKHPERWVLWNEIPSS